MEWWDIGNSGGKENCPCRSSFFMVRPGDFAVNFWLFSSILKYYPVYKQGFG